MSNSSTWLIDRTLLGATTLGQDGPGSHGNEEILCVSQSSSNTKASPSDCFMSYLEQSLRESYPSAKMQLVYSTAPVDWANLIKIAPSLLLKLVDQFIYLSSNISSSESFVNISIEKEWIAMSGLLIIRKSDLCDIIKWEFFQAINVSVLLFSYLLTLTKRLETKLDGNETRMLHTILNKYCKQHSTKKTKKKSNTTIYLRPHTPSKYKVWFGFFV